MSQLMSPGIFLGVFVLAGLFGSLTLGAETRVLPYTVFVYMVGADLESNGGGATVDLTEMAKVGSTKNVNVLVETGGSKKWNLPMISNKVNQRWLVQKDNLKLVKNDLGSRNMGKQSTLQDFLIWGVKNYPAKKYAVVLWGGNSLGVNGFGYDENFADKEPTLTLQEINGAIKAATAISKQKFDLLGFDGLLMGNNEAAKSIKDYVYFMVSSENLEPGHDWDYLGALQSLNKKPTMTGLELAKAISSAYKTQAMSQGTVGKQTLSVIDLSKVK